MTRIMIDPGHGGEPGAIGRDPFKVRECDVNWTVSTLLRQALERQGLTVATTRRQGEAMGLSKRAARANAFGASVFVSVHCNSHTQTRAHGLEVLHFGSEPGRSLASALLDQLSRHPPFGPAPFNRGLKVRPRLTVLRKTRMPACLVELPFLSSPADLASVIEPVNQIFWAQAIADGVWDWLHA